MPIQSDVASRQDFSMYISSTIANLLSPLNSKTVFDIGTESKTG